MPVSLAGLAQERGDVGVVEARQVELEQARPLGVVRAAQLLQVDIGDGLRQRKYGVLAIVTRAQIAQFLAEQRHEDDAAPGPLGERGERLRNLDHRRRAAGVVVGAVVDVVAFASAANAQVIVVRGEHQVGVFQRRVGAAQNADHVAQLDGLCARGRRDVRRNLDASCQRPAPARASPHRRAWARWPDAGRYRAVADRHVSRRPAPHRSAPSAGSSATTAAGMPRVTELLRDRVESQDQHLAAHLVRRQRVDAPRRPSSSL